MLFYVLFICAIIAFFALSRAYSIGNIEGRIWEGVALFVIIFVGIFRFDVGWDYVNYYNYIDRVEIVQILRLEPFSQLLCVIAIIFNSPPLLFVLFGLPTYLIIFYSLRRFSVNFQFSILVFLAFFYLESFTSIRQLLALSISFWGFKYILEKSFFKYALIILFAALFHASALIALFIYPIYYFLNIRMLLFLIPVLFIAKEIMLKVLYTLGIYSYYIDKLEEYTGGGLVRYIQIALFGSLLLLDYFKKIDQQDNKFFTIIGVVLLFPFMLGPSLGNRLGMYFLIYLCLLVPIVLNKYSVKYRICYAICFVFYFLTMIYIGSNNAFKSLYVPYQFVFNVENIQFR